MNKFLAILLAVFTASCTFNQKGSSGISLPEITKSGEEERRLGLPVDSLNILTKPRNILLTGNKAHRLTPIYRVSYYKRSGRPYTGTTYYLSNYSDYGDNVENKWHQNFMPGFEAAQGNNLVNISHTQLETGEQTSFFEHPVWIRTLYYPAFSNDTLNGAPITRDFYMVSAYDEDTNGDGYINRKDLRRLYHFDIDGKNKAPLIPKAYSVMSSEYDPANDVMYVVARKDENENGKMEYEEATHIFWIDLKNPEHRGMQYGTE